MNPRFPTRRPDYEKDLREIGRDAAVGIEYIFVGRAAELDLLRSFLQEVVAGDGRAVLVGGEAGIGKTSLAEQLAEVARSSDVDVVWGRCWEGEGAPAFWPWIQIVRSLALRRDPHELRSVMGPGAADMVQLVPELRGQMPDLRSLPEPLEPEQARFRLFDSIGTFLRRWTKNRPALLILDDIHWADKPSLRLLQFILQDLEGVGLLVVATYRDDNVSQWEVFSDTLPDLVRARATSRLKLLGLDRHDVAEFIAATAGKTPSESLTISLHAETDGNPLFVSELVRALVQSGAAVEREVTSTGVAVPDTLREAIVRRVRSLSPEGVKLVQASSVAGRQFNLRVVERAIKDERISLGTLEEACAVRIFERVAQDNSMCRFTHAVVREAIYEELSESRRRGLHLAIGRATEEVYRGELDNELSVLSFHFSRALPDGDVEKAVRYGMRAAERATRLLAHEEAVDHYRRSLVAERSRTGDPFRRCEILLALGHALTRAGDLLGAKETFTQAAEVARQAEAGDQLAHAALGICGLFPATGGADVALRRLLEEVLDHLDGSVNGLHAKVLSAASTALQFSWPGKRRIEVCQRALSMAKEAGDIRAELHALDASYYAFLNLCALPERFAIAEEIVRLADEVGDKEMALRGHIHLLTNYLDSNNVAAADLELDVLDGLAIELRQPSYQWQVALLRAMRALLRGAFQDARELSDQARVMGEKFSDARALLAFWAQEVWLRRDLGKLEEIEAVARRSASVGAATYPWEAVVVLLLAEIGRHGEARRLLSLWKTREFPDNPFLMTVLSLLAAASGIVGDTDLAPLLYERMRPCQGRGVTPGLGTSVFLGAVDLYLGILASLMRNLPLASDHLSDALEIHLQMGARPLTARTRFEYGKVLSEMGRYDEAREQLNGAITEFEALGMIGCLDRGREVLSRLNATAGSTGAVASVADASVGARGQPSVFTSDGDYWTVTFAGKTARLKSVRGFHYIAYLLAHANESVHALDLAVLGLRAADVGVDVAVASQESLRVAGFGVHGTVLDERARAEYRRRLRELAAERDETQRLNDYGRQEQIDAEIGAIESYLMAGTGRGGRSRPWISPGERARVSVRNAIAKALRSISRHHQPLHRHLQNSIKTGAVCSYVPEEVVSWQIVAH